MPAAPKMSVLMRSRFYRLGAFAFRRRLWVVIAWVLVFAAMMSPLQKLTTRLSQGGFEVAGSQSDFVRRAIASDFRSRTELTDLIVMRSASLSAGDPSFKDAFARVRDELSKQPGIAFISDPYASADPRTVMC